jgi:hypothetical protein
METVMKKHKKQGETDVVVRLDAVSIAADEFRKKAFEQLAGYRRAYNWLLPGGDERMYSRVSQYVNDETGMKIQVSHDRVHAFMPPCIVTLSPCDQTGMQRSELEEVLSILPNSRFLKLEIAHDFCVDSVVNESFARKHLMIGKSQRRPEHPNRIEFGSRKSPVFARGYWKKEIQSFRIEIEYHREWLKKHGIKSTSDFLKLPDLTARQHIAFFKIDSLKLSAALDRLGIPVAPTLKKIIARDDDLHAALRYLRRSVGLANTLRILTPLATNGRIERALRLWAKEWDRRAYSKDAVE